MMRVPVRSTIDLFLAALMILPGLVMDMWLVGIFKSHVQQSPAFGRYRPNYLRSGRRNRVRY